MSSDKAKAETRAFAAADKAIGAGYIGYQSFARGFLEGRRDFIEHELRGLLEAARLCRPLITDDGSYVHSIDELIEKARKG